MLKGFAGSLLLCLFFLGETGCAWLQPAPQIIAVEFVRDGSIPQIYRIEPPNCSYAELTEVTVKDTEIGEKRSRVSVRRKSRTAGQDVTR